MNMQQAVQPKSSANGFGRRRPDREGALKFDNKLQSGKSGHHRSRAAVKIGACDSPSRDRLVYLSTCIIGHPVEVQLKNGSMYSGTCYTTNIDKEFAIILKMARVLKDVSLKGQKAESVSKAPSKTLIIAGKDVMQVIAKDVTVTVDGMSSESQREKQQDLMIDSLISQSRHVEVERELARWIPDKDDPQCPELENIFDGPRNRGWDQFEANKALFGVKSTFNEELYTTKLEKGPQMWELEREATRIAREIEGEETNDPHLAEERGIHPHGDLDEETRFSSVNRGRVVDDRGYDEIEDIMSDLRNSETFGGASASSFEKSADLTYGKSIDGARVLSNLSLDEAQCSQSSTGSDLYFPGSYEHSRHLASELPLTSSTSDSESRVHDILPTENDGDNGFKECLEEQVVAHDAQVPKCDDSQPLTSDKKDGSEKVGLSPNATAYAPSHLSSKTHEKMSLPSVMSDGASPALPAKGSAEMQSANSRGGRPSSSTSSNSERVAASSFSGPGLSPSSSVGSLSSEKSTLNPHAKEFRLNPNAKSFTPSQTPVRPASPASDASYYPANLSPLPHMHGMPLGIGIGPSFTGHQPVIFNPQIAPLQTPPTLFHPGGPQYGQQVLLGQPRQVLYMQTYQPEMPYRGREF